MTRVEGPGRRVLLVHPTGNLASRNVALALAGADLLAEFCTAVSWNSGGALSRVLPRSLQAELQRRSFADELRPFLHTWPYREAGRLLATRLRWRSALAHETGPFCVDAVYRSLDRYAARRARRSTTLTAVYAYEDGAHELFRAASRAGIARYYDQPIGHWRAARAILAEEAERLPEWAATITGLRDSAEKLARKDAELRLADRILVASTFTRRTLEGVDTGRARIDLVPYGAPPVIRPARRATGSRMRVLFVGSLSQRKGIAYVFEAVRRLGVQVELTLIGRPPAPCPALERELGRHRWLESLPHAHLLEEMAAHDVLLFPSLFEGFGLVILEAMSRGLPVIATPHTAAPDILQDGVDGYIVPVRDVDAIVDRCERLRSDHGLHEAMRDAALATAERWTWARYQQSIVETMCRE